MDIEPIEVRVISISEVSRHMVVQLEQFNRTIGRATISFQEFANSSGLSYWRQLARRSRARRRYQRRIARIHGQDPYQIK